MIGKAGARVWRRMACGGAAAMLAAGTLGAGHAQGVAKGLDFQVVTTPTQQLAAALTSIGMTNCAAKAVRVADFLFEKGEAKFTVQPMGPDGNRFSTVIVIEGGHTANGATRLSTVMVTPDCSGFYEQVIHWAEPCERLKTVTFADFTGERVLLRKVKVSELGPAVQLYLMPAGTGCVSVKKELFR